MQSFASNDSSDTPTASAAAGTRSSQQGQEAKVQLQDLIPIAMVIVGGCETCAERMVSRALAQGSSWQDIDKTLRIIEGMQNLDCFAKAVGADVLTRMNKPLAAGKRTLQEAMRRAGE